MKNGNKDTEVKSEIIKFRVSKGEKKEITSMMKRNKINLSVFVREALLKKTQETKQQIKMNF